MYEQSVKLADVLDIPLTLHFTLNPLLETHRRYDPSRHEGDDEAPEVSLAAVLIVAMKMNYRNGEMKRWDTCRFGGVGLIS